MSEFQNFQKVRPYVLGKSCPLGRAILEISEIFGNPESERIPKKSALMFWNILSTRSGHFGNFGNFGNPESEGVPKFPKFQKVRPYVLENPVH